MKYRNEKFDGFAPKEKYRNPREKHLCEIMRYWGYHLAADNIDFRRERIDVEAAIDQWTNFPKCMDTYPSVITKKVKLDPREELLIA